MKAEISKNEKGRRIMYSLSSLHEFFFIICNKLFHPNFLLTNITTIRMKQMFYKVGYWEE